jgi:hypothetical protein
LAPGVKMQPDNDLLVQLAQTSAATAEKVTALHDQLLGEHGVIGQLKDDIERLYRRDKEVVEQFTVALKDLRSEVQAVQTSAAESVAEPRSWIERGKAIGGLAIAVGLLVDIAVHARGLLR